MNTPSPPPVPSASSIVQTSQTANNVNQNTPYASLNYAQGPNGQWTATSTPTGPMGQAFNNNAQVAASNTPAGIGQTVQSAEQAGMNYMQPWFQQQQSNLDSQLHNQGFSPGDAAAQQDQRQLQTNQSNYIASQLPQWQQMAQQQYMLPYQAAAAAYQPNFVQTPQTDVTGAYNTQMQGNEYNYGQQMATNNAMLGGLFSIPSAALGGWAKNGFALSPSIGNLFGGGS